MSQHKTILITGAGGFIGRHLIYRLGSLRYQVVLTDNLSDNIDVPFSSVRYYKCDLTKESEVKKIAKIIKGKIILLHLAAYVPKSADKKDDLIDKSFNVNLEGMIKLIDNLKNRLCKICFTSTLEVYGRPIYLPIDEKHPTNPYSFYGLSKLIAERYLSTFCRKCHIPLSILRFSSVYGPGEMYDRAIPNFVTQALRGLPLYIYGDGLDVRDYVYVDDVVDVLISCINNRDSYGIFNIATGKGCTIKKIAELIIRLSSSKSKITFRPRRKKRYKLIFDISQAKNKIGFKPKVDIKQGLINEINWFRKI